MQPRGTSYVGYVGLLTGMKPGAFSISLDQRDSGTLLENFLELLLVPNTMAACFLIRDTLQKQNSFHEAVERLSHTSLVAPSYIIIGGVSTDEGAVVTRDRIAALDLWFLDGSNHRWFLVETNYDHWKPAGDDRRQVANEGMNATGKQNISLNTIFGVLSTPPVLNDQTTYTTLMSAAAGNYTTYARTYTMNNDSRVPGAP